MLRSAVRFPKQPGIVPESLFELKSKYPKFLKWHRTLGMDPCIRFPGIANHCSFCRCPNDIGINPVKSLSLSLKSIKLIKLPIPVGMVPLNWQADASKLSREMERFPNEFGRIPFKGLSSIHNLLKNLQFVREVRKPTSEAECSSVN